MEPSWDEEVAFLARENKDKDKDKDRRQSLEPSRDKEEGCKDEKNLYVISDKDKDNDRKWSLVPSSWKVAFLIMGRNILLELNPDPNDQWNNNIFSNSLFQLEGPGVAATP